MKNLLFLFSILALVSSTNARADASDWSGLYAGLNAGGGIGETADNHPIASQSFDEDISGFIGGILIGYNHSISPNLIAGIEADLSSANLAASGPCTAFLFTCQSTIDWVASIRARGGTTIGDTLLFATGGVAFTESYHSTTPAFVGFDDRAFRTGWVVGLGAEKQLSNEFTVGLEGLYYDFGNAATVGGTSDRIEMNLFTVRARISYRFGR